MISTEHGGNIILAAARIGCRPSDMVDMSSNLNPLGPPPGLLDHLKEKIHEIGRLPEMDAVSCIRAYVRQYDIDPGSAQSTFRRGRTEVHLARNAGIY